MEDVFFEEGGKKYKAPSEDDRRRGVKIEVKDAPGTESIDSLKQKAAGQGKITAPTSAADDEDKPGDSPLVAAGKKARRAAKAREAGNMDPMMKDKLKSAMAR